MSGQNLFPFPRKKLATFPLSTDGCSFSVKFKECLLYEITELQLEGKKNASLLHSPEPGMQSTLGRVLGWRWVVREENSYRNPTEVHG